MTSSPLLCPLSQRRLRYVFQGKVCQLPLQVFVKEVGRLISFGRIRMEAAIHNGSGGGRNGMSKCAHIGDRRAVLHHLVDTVLKRAVACRKWQTLSQQLVEDYSDRINIAAGVPAPWLRSLHRAAIALKAELFRSRFARLSLR